jgi:hypothetical protein
MSSGSLLTHLFALRLMLPFKFIVMFAGCIPGGTIERLPLIGALIGAISIGLRTESRNRRHLRD